MKGYNGKLLRVNLENGHCLSEQVDETRARKFIGGSGYAADILYRELKAGIDPLGSDNKIVFSTSPLSENIVAGGGSIILCFKSPLTNGWGESRCGGNFGPDLRRSGFDFIVVEGRSKHAVYLEIINGKAQLKDASSIAGKDIYEKTDWIEDRLPEDIRNKSVMCIGPAGENLVRFASVMCRDRAAGRCGGGAVMGSKNLLAVAVCGKNKIDHSDESAYIAAVRKVTSTVKGNELCDGFNEFGTIGDMPANDEDGDWPSKNWRSNSWGEGARLFDHFQEKNLIRPNQCYTGCPIGCGRICEVKEGPYKTPKHEGGEYETLSVFTSYVLNKDMDVAVHCDYLCNKWGLDTISAGAMIAFAMDCYENNIISETETDGLDLTWGNAEIMPQLLEMIAFKKGFGKMLAEGVQRASNALGQGSEAYAIHVKGLEGPAHDPRSGKMLGIAYGTSNRGMCHIHPLEGMAYDRGKMDWGLKQYGVSDPETIDRWDEKGKGNDCTILQRGLILSEILNTCKFMSYAGVNPEHWAEMLSASTGWDINAAELLLIGERVHNLQRLFNVREGFRRDDDQLPERVMSIPEFGIYKNQENCVIGDYQALLDEYYIASGWDPDTGIPTENKLKELGLENYAL
jgi:aldehyde:ferredoxin oxidoreductase